MQKEGRSDGLVLQSLTRQETCHFQFCKFHSLRLVCRKSFCYYGRADLVPRTCPQGHATGLQPFRTSLPVSSLSMEDGLTWFPRLSKQTHPCSLGLNPAFTCLLRGSEIPSKARCAVPLCKLSPCRSHSVFWKCFIPAILARRRYIDRFPRLATP